jgi:hypothetical protein
MLGCAAKVTEVTGKLQAQVCECCAVVKKKYDRFRTVNAFYETTSAEAG